MIGWSLCSGIGAPEVAAPWMDWRLASEIEPFPRAVLQARFGYRVPEDHNQGDPLLWGDMTEVTPDLARARGVPLPDLLVAGTPCQAFSVAGLRQGTADARGNLTLKFVETCHAIVDARPDGRLAVLWENVPGVLSDKGNAFGCFLGGLVGAVDALQPPGDGSWPGEGMVQGPRARAAWCVLDAQYFGVAQRRRRVFVVVDFGNCVDPAAVLLEPESLRGHPPSRGKAGQVAPTVPARSTGGGGLGTDFDCDGGLIPEIVPQAMSSKWSKGSSGPAGDEVANLIPVVSPTLRAGGHHGSHANAGVPPGIAYAIQERAVSENPDAGPQGKGWNEGTGFTLEARNKVQAVAFDLATTWAVRRLTPTECHRLQGFPDDHCAITVRGKPAADGPQYKALGNSMAVPCIAWILNRMKISMEGRA
jgi:DNA (cytosine-5)-methyltransferase 1